MVNGAFKDIPIEVYETKYPVTLRQYGFCPDTGGAGRQRGGCGVHGRGAHRWGGGFGTALERDPDMVLRDVLDEYVTRNGANRDYGVVERDGSVDEEATLRVRSARRATI